jgi:hypothetical protein
MKNTDIFNNEVYESADDITDLILQRACRTSAGADSFFKIQTLLCLDDTFVTQKTFLHDPPIRVDVFIADCQRPDSWMKDSSSSVSGSESSNEPRGSSSYLNNLLSFSTSNNSNRSSKNSLMNAVNIQRANNLALYYPSNCNSDGLRFDAICSRVSVQNSFAIYDTDSIDQITGGWKGCFVLILLFCLFVFSHLMLCCGVV